MRTEIEDSKCITITVSKNNKTGVIHGSAWTVEMSKVRQRMMQRELRSKKDIGADKTKDMDKYFFSQSLSKAPQIVS